MKIIFRILGYPFVLALFLIARFRDTLIFSYRWFARGGEILTFDPQDKNKIADLIRILEKDRLTVK